MRIGKVGLVVAAIVLVVPALVVAIWAHRVIDELFGSRPSTGAVTRSTELTDPTAESERFEYDSKACSSNAEGMIYVAVGRDEFRFPAEKLTFIGTRPRDFIGTDREEPASQPEPNSTDPEGCPSNPLRARSFSFAIAYPGELSPASHNPMLEQFEILAVENSLPGLQGSNEFVAENWCGREDVIHQIIDGALEECRFPDANKTFPDAESSRVFRSLPGAYSAPFGRPYIVVCHHGILTQCEVNYRLSETIKVRYKFLLKRIRSSDLVKLDQALRKQIEDARVSNDPWPPEPDN